MCRMKKRLVRLAVWTLAAFVVISAAVAGTEYWRTRQIRRALYEAFTPVHIKNCTLQRFGGDNDGGYLMCGNLMAAGESAYSYGIDGDDAWGCEVIAATGLRIHQYDCYNTTVPACDGGRTMFHAECVAPERDVVASKPFNTMANQIQNNGDTGKRLIVKIDVEGSEWRTLAAAPDHVLEAIDQMAVEFHGVEQPHFLETAARLRQFFYVAHVHQNNFLCQDGYDPFPGQVFEVLFVSKRLAVADPWVNARAPSPLDAPNTSLRPDCQQSPGGTEFHRLARWTRRKVSSLAERLAD
jgi:hypothetical protein